MWRDTLRLSLFITQNPMSSEKSANPSQPKETNPKETKEDFLEEDPEIRSQKFVLLSFLSPESVLNSKDQFFFGEFVKSVL